MHINTNFLRAIKNPKKAFLFSISIPYNTIINLLWKKKHNSSDLKELDEITVRSLVRNDISDHLVTLFVESLNIKPKLIVELGVRTGGSTFVFEKVAKLFNSALVSVDINDCSGASAWKEWKFVQSDDIDFAKNFERWCKKHNIDPVIDILYIDTSHFFEHTYQEIKSWFPFLSDKSKVFFHDTNLKEMYFRKDGSAGIVWTDYSNDYNGRGVIQAIEKYFEKTFYEQQDFIDYKNGWLIKHYSNCCGLTILEKISPITSKV